MTVKTKKEITNEDETILKKVGRLIAQARIDSGITQVELAARLDLDQSVICCYEQGKRRIPINQFVKIARAIGISPAKLLEEMDKTTAKGNNGRPSRRFSKRMKEIEKLSDFEQRALAKTIDAFLIAKKSTSENQR